MKKYFKYFLIVFVLYCLLSILNVHAETASFSINTGITPLSTYVTNNSIRYYRFSVQNTGSTKFYLNNNSFRLEKSVIEFNVGINLANLNGIEISDSQGSLGSCSLNGSINAYDSSSSGYTSVKCETNRTATGTDVGITFNYSSSSQGHLFLDLSVDYNYSKKVDNQDILDNQNQNNKDLMENQDKNNQDLMDNQDKNKDEIIDNQNQNNQDLMENQDKNKDEIIDNQNKNNEELQGTIKDQFTNCRDSRNLFTSVSVSLPYTTDFKGGKSTVVTLEYNDDFANNYMEKGFTVKLRLKDPLEKPFHNFRFGIDTTNPNEVNGLNVNYFHFDTRVDSEGYIIYEYYLSPETLSTHSYYKNLKLSDSSFQIRYYYLDNIPEGSTLYDAELSYGDTRGQALEPMGGEQICTNRMDETNDKLDSVNGQLGDLNDNITSSDTSEGNNSAGSFFSDFEDNDHGLSSIITAPLNFIKSLLSNTCKDLSLPLPYVKSNLNLPCMSTIYSQNFGLLFTLYQTITTGFVAYWVSVRIYALVKGFKDPDNDRIEVMDL